jgi:hypothetical protein
VKYTVSHMHTGLSGFALIARAIMNSEIASKVALPASPKIILNSKFK